MPTVYPIVPGHEIVGRVTKVGSAVTRFKPGDLAAVGCMVDSDGTCPECRAGLVLQGRLRPTDCPEFGTRCTPEHPLGATMVSTEGACAAYFHYRRPPREAAAVS